MKKKNLLILLACAAIALTLCACGNKEPDPNIKLPSMTDIIFEAGESAATDDSEFWKEVSAPELNDVETALITEYEESSWSEQIGQHLLKSIKYYCPEEYGSDFINNVQNGTLHIVQNPADSGQVDLITTNAWYNVHRWFMSSEEPQVILKNVDMENAEVSIHYSQLADLSYEFDRVLSVAKDDKLKLYDSTGSVILTIPFDTETDTLISVKWPRTYDDINNADPISISSCVVKVLHNKNGYSVTTYLLSNTSQGVVYDPEVGFEYTSETLDFQESVNGEDVERIYVYKNNEATHLFMKTEEGNGYFVKLGLLDNYPNVISKYSNVVEDTIGASLGYVYYTVEGNDKYIFEEDLYFGKPEKICYALPDGYTTKDIKEFIPNSESVIVVLNDGKAFMSPNVRNVDKEDGTTHIFAQFKEIETLTKLYQSNLIKHIAQVYDEIWVVTTTNNLYSIDVAELEKQYELKTLDVEHPMP